MKVDSPSLRAASSVRASPRRIASTTSTNSRNSYFSSNFRDGSVPKINFTGIKYCKINRTFRALCA